MLCWNTCTKSLDRCYAQLKLIWPNQLPLMTSIYFLTMQHGQFALPITQYLKPHQVQPYFGQVMLVNILFVADWHKIKNYRQSPTDRNNKCKNNSCIDYGYMVRDKVLVEKRHTPQSRVQVQQRAMDYHNSSCEWNYQDSMQDQNGKTQYPESNSIYR